MTTIEKRSLIESVLYILNKTGGIDYYHLFKILYFADRAHLAKWGTRFVHDDFYALEFGPVPTELYDAVKGNPTHTEGFLNLFNQSVGFAGEDAPNVLIAKRKPDLDYLSQSGIEVLDQSIDENAFLSFNKLKEKSHDDAWEEAFFTGTHIISPLSMAKAGSASEGILQYIVEQQEIDKMLS